MIPKTEFYVAVQSSKAKKKSWYFLFSISQNTTFLLMEIKLSEASSIYCWTNTIFIYK